VRDARSGKAPAPWTLTGKGYILAVRLPRAQLDNESFIPDGLRGTRRGRLAYVMFVDYERSDVGPYRELLYIPGSLRFRDARRLSITKIYVSTRDSVVNGQENWGIPKERCDFAVAYGDGRDRVALQAEDGTAFAELEFREKRWRLPVNTRFVPTRLRTLSQHWAGRQFTYTPAARGHVKLASLVSARFDAAYFPDLARGTVVSCLKVTDFTMVFPVAVVTPA
jgi:hypothetical protein